MSISTRRQVGVSRASYSLERAEPPKSSADTFKEHLSSRELEIARLASEGLSNKEIALVLQISHHTVSTHLRRIYDKLGLHRRARLATYIVARTDDAGDRASAGPPGDA